LLQVRHGFLVDRGQVHAPSELHQSRTLGVSFSSATWDGLDVERGRFLEAGKRLTALLGELQGRVKALAVVFSSCSRPRQQAPAASFRDTS